MPEATVNEHHRVVAGKDYVRTSEQVAPVETEPEAGTMQQLPDEDFGLRILLRDRGHDPRARRRVNGVDHAETGQFELEMLGTRA